MNFKEGGLLSTCPEEWVTFKLNACDTLEIYTFLLSSMRNIIKRTHS